MCHCVAKMNNRNNKKTVICHLSNLENIKIANAPTSEMVAKESEREEVEEEQRQKKTMPTHEKKANADKFKSYYGCDEM